MCLKAGRQNVAGFEDSMAQDIEKAFRAAWKEFKNVYPPDISIDYMKPLFIAIAQGVIKHLTDKIDAINVINVSVDQKENNLIQSTGTIDGSGGGSYYSHDVTVIQDLESEDLLNPENIIQCRDGTGDIEIEIIDGDLFTDIELNNGIDE